MTLLGRILELSKRLEVEHHEANEAARAVVRRSSLHPTPPPRSDGVIDITQWRRAGAV